MPSSRKVKAGSGRARAARMVAVEECCEPSCRLRPNLVETMKCPGSFCTWTWEVCAPAALETAPRSKLRWPEAPPARAAPSGALMKLTEMDPTVSDFMETTVEVRRLALLCCAHPPVRSEEYTSELQSQFHLVCRLLLEKKK